MLLAVSELRGRIEVVRWRCVEAKHSLTRTVSRLSVYRETVSFYRNSEAAHTKHGRNPSSLLESPLTIMSPHN